MSLLLITVLAGSIVATAFLSGIFGMAGGMILIGILLAILPVPAAMALHAVTQLASNGWRAFLWRRHIVWPPVAVYAAGGVAALAAWSLTQYVPSAPIALIMLGVSPFMTRLVPARFKPNPESRPQAALYGAICISMMLLTGVAGPLLDSFFLGGKLTRQQIVSTKSACQVFGHALKLLYFGGIVDQAAGVEPIVAMIAVVCAMAGTTLARRVLESMSDTQYRVWATRIVTAIACFYILQGSYLLVTA
jgi:uncharacterized membrane protein YfcA